MENSWFALWVATGQEKNLRPWVEKVPGVDQVVLPIEYLWEHKEKAWNKQERILFPGYIFLRCTMTSSIYYTLKQMPHVMGWLGKDSVWPSTIRQEEMDVVLGIQMGQQQQLLKDITINKRQRRGYGTLTLQGVEHKIPFNIYDDKQPEAPEGDASPAAADGE